MARLQHETQNLVTAITNHLMLGMQPSPEQLEALARLISVQLGMSVDPAHRAQLKNLNSQLAAWRAQAQAMAPRPPTALSTAGPPAPARGSARQRGRGNNRGEVKGQPCATFNDIKKVPHAPAVRMLYDDLPHLIKLDGLRVRTSKEVQEHLDWLFVQNKRKRARQDGSLSRCWYSTLEEWVGQSEEVRKGGPVPDKLDLGKEAMGADAPEGGAIVNDGETCPVCGEGFDVEWDDGKGAWVGKDAWRETAESPVMHVQCAVLTSPGPGSPTSPGSPWAAGAKRKLAAPPTPPKKRPSP